MKLRSGVAWILGLMAAASTAVVARQTATQQPPRPPAIRTGITTVPVDVRVVDRNGNAITDLKQEDFAILEEGVPQAIRHFSVQTFTADASAAGERPEFRPAGDLEIAPRNRRVFLFLLGRGRHADVSPYIDALRTFASRRVLPQDQLAVVAWNRATEFTTDHALIARTIQRYAERHRKIETDLREWFSGLRAVYGSKTIPPHIQRDIDWVFQDSKATRARALLPATVADEKQIRDDARTVSDALMRQEILAERLEGSGLPDIMAENTADLAGMTFDEYVARTTQSTQDLGAIYGSIQYLRHLEGEKHLVLLTETGMSLPRQEQMTAFARIASDARITFNVIQTGGVAGPPPPRLNTRPGPGPTSIVQPVATPAQVFNQTFAMQDLRLVSDMTGGQFQAFTKAADVFDRLERTAQVQYLLGYYPSNPARDGKYRKVTVKVNRPGARVFARQGYFATDRYVALDRRQMLTSTRVRAAAMYQGVLDHIGVSLGPASVAGEGASRALTIEIAIDVSRVRFTRDGDRHVAMIDVAMFCGDEKQRVVGERWQEVSLRLTDAMLQQILKDKAHYVASVPLTGEPRFVKVIAYNYEADLLGAATAKIAR